MIRDSQFGFMVVVGFGGIYVEVLEDTGCTTPSLERCEALDMPDELRMAELEVNALVAAPDGVVVVDARARME